MVDEMPRCYVFLPADEKHPVRLAVGHYWGISLFELPEQGAPRRTRLFRGHEGYVTSLALAPDGMKLLSTSRDQTVAGWNLEDWPYHPSLGAQFYVADGRLFVGKVAAGSPTWEMGLDPDDEIVYLAAAGRPVYNPLPEVAQELGIPRMPASAADAQAALQAAVPDRLLDVAWRRAGRKTLLKQVTSVVDRPVWRFFPTRGKEWVLWRWRDYAYDCSTNGDYFIGWQRSHGLWETRAPDFYRAEQFRNKFLDPAGISRMLDSWKGGLALQSFRDWEPPAVRIVAQAPDDGVIRGRDAELRIVIEPRGPRAFQAPERLLVWLNDYQAEEVPAARLQRSGDAYETSVRIEAGKFRAGKNLILAQCYSRDGLRGESAPLALHAPPPAEPQALYGLIVGVGDYRKASPPQPNLKANLDAEVLREAWQGQQGKLFRTVDVTLLTDEEVTPAAVLGALQRLARKVRPDDLLVLHLGGHGVSLTKLAELRDAKGKQLLTKDTKTALQRQKGPFLFLCPDLHFDRLLTTTIGFAELYAQLIKLPCHKLILLDACHAGAGSSTFETEEDPIRILTHDGVGPVILASCGRDESALESDTYDFARAFGFFTIALRRLLQEKKAFDEADRNHDSVLSAREVADNIERQVAQLLQRMRREQVARVPSQTPSSFVPTMETELRLMKR
jgi:hypothetical protein